MNRRHILWVNEASELVGGCEQYISNTVNLLKDLGFRNSLLYHEVSQRVAPGMLGIFDSAFPIVDVARQVADIGPGLIYIQRLRGKGIVSQLAATGVPALRFFHDYQLFCLREHKYGTLTHRTCAKPIGWRCYACLGFLNRSEDGLGIRLSRLGPLRAELNENKQLTGFVVGSRYMADHVAAHGFDRAKIHVLPLYAMPPRPGLPVERERDLLIYIGQLLRGKGLDTLFQALAMTKHPARLRILGGGRQEALFQGQAKAMGLEKRIYFEGRVPHATLSEFYRRAACAVVPSRYPETFGLIGPEAMSHAIPVIATTVGGMNEWMEDGVTGFAVPPNDAGALAKAIDRVVGDPELAARLGEQGRRRYEERFRPQKHIDGLVRVFDQMAQKGS